MINKIAIIVLGICLLTSVAGCSSRANQNTTPQSVSSQVSSSEVQTVPTVESSDFSQESTPPIAPPDTNELENLTKSYLIPIMFSGATMKSWTDANTLDAKSFIYMYGYAQVWNADISESEMIFENEIPYYYVSEEILESYVKTYFIVSTDHLRLSEEYDAQKQAYKFNMSGVGFAYDPQVKRAEYDDAKKELILYVDSGFEEKRNEAATLTILLEQDGSFRYINNSYYGK